VWVGGKRGGDSQKRRDGWTGGVAGERFRGDVK